ncbi:hypothetical protein RI367_006250 [Sorochytrium milnesiophthora]
MSDADASSHAVDSSTGVADTAKSTERDVTDEQILEYEARIKDQEARKNELVSVPLPLDELQAEYKAGSPVFYEKIAVASLLSLPIAFAWFERILQNPTTALPTALARLDEAKSLLQRNGFQLLSFEDFLDATVDTVTAIGKGTISDMDMLLSRFQYDEISNSIVVMLRFITSAWLQDAANRDEFEPFVMEWGGVELFCTQQVEAMGRESEEIQIIAATRALQLAAQVAYLDGNMSSTEVNFHKYVPDNAFNSEDPVILLYRPGHYDLLYKR